MDYSFDYFIVHPAMEVMQKPVLLKDLYLLTKWRWTWEFSWSDPAMKANPYVGREPRFYASILYNGAPWKGQTLYTYEGCNDGYALGGGTTCAGYYMRKLFDENYLRMAKKTDWTYYYMRYAEVLLIYAEAGRTRGYSCSMEALEQKCVPEIGFGLQIY